MVYASSIHAVGFYPVETVPDTRAMHRPDTFYGLTKTFIEDLASLYWDKFGLESVMLRICSCFEEPRDRRMLWSWLSFADCVRLVEAALTAPRVGFSVIYGTSDNAAAARLERPRRPHRLPRRRTAPTAIAAAVLARTGGRIRRRVATRVVGGGFAATAASRRCLSCRGRPGAALRGPRGDLARGRGACGSGPGRCAAATGGGNRVSAATLDGPGRGDIGDGRGGDARLGPAAALQLRPGRGGARRGAGGARLRGRRTTR